MTGVQTCALPISNNLKIENGDFQITAYGDDGIDVYNDL